MDKYLVKTETLNYSCLKSIMLARHLNQSHIYFSLQIVTVSRLRSNECIIIYSVPWWCSCLSWTLLLFLCFKRVRFIIVELDLDFGCFVFMWTIWITCQQQSLVYVCVCVLEVGTTNDKTLPETFLQTITFTSRKHKFMMFFYLFIYLFIYFFFNLHFSKPITWYFHCKNKDKEFCN